MAPDPRIGRGISEGSGNPGDEPTFGFGAEEDRTEPPLTLKMLHDLISDVGGLKEAIAELRRVNENSGKHFDDMKSTYEGLKPDIERLNVFSTYTIPHLAKKEDVANAKSELKDAISERPKVTTILTVIGLIFAVAAGPFVPVWWAHVQLLFSPSPGSSR